MLPPENITFIVEAGVDFPYQHLLKKALKESVRRATDEIPLRPNAMSPFDDSNTGDNTGHHVPFFYWSLVEGDSVEITVLPKGGGSENMSVVGMLNPAERIRAVKEFVVDHVLKCGGKPCPPVLVGVGSVVLLTSIGSEISSFSR